MQLIIATVVTAIAAGLFFFGTVCYTGIVPKPKEKTENPLVTWARKFTGQALGLSLGLLAAGTIIGALAFGAW